MKYNICFTILLIGSLFFSCTKEQGNPDLFKYGTFEIPAGKGYSKTIIERVDSLQIETFTKTVTISNDSAVYEKQKKRVDTFYIKWKNNFAYILKMKNPKTDLDKEKIYIQINKITKTSYDFTARIGYSKYKQKGTVYIRK